jgi:hypothetical protein
VKLRGQESWPIILPKCTTSTEHLVIFTRRKSTTWDRRIYFPSEGRRAEDFYALKNPMASAGFEPANLGTKGQHATPRPPKPLFLYLRPGFQKSLFPYFFVLISHKNVSHVLPIHSSFICLFFRYSREIKIYRILPVLLRSL